MTFTHVATFSIVGATPDFGERVRAAMKFVQFNGQPLRYEEWDGTRRSVVIAAPDSHVGEVALRLTRQRGGIAIEVHRRDAGDGACLSEHATVEEIREMLSATGRFATPLLAEPLSRIASDITPGGALGLICQQAHRSSEFILRRFQHDILISHTKGRVIARSAHLFGVLKAKLLDDDWMLINDDATVGGFTDTSGLTATSLEALLVESCIGHRNRLPPQPAGRVSIELIPDIAAVSDNGESLLMAAKLRKGIDDVAQAAHNMGVEESRLTAMLWAMQASGLLMRESIAASATPDANRKRHSSPPPGLIRRLALRVGFSGVTHA